MLNNYVIVRDHMAGVFAGTLSWQNENHPKHIKLTNVRKLWEWYGAAAVEQLAESGTSKPNECKFSVETEEQQLFDCVQIIKATDAAKKNIQAVPEWRR
jgi:hypothetical protein